MIQAPITVFCQEKCFGKGIEMGTLVVDLSEI